MPFLVYFGLVSHKEEQENIPIINLLEAKGYVVPKDSLLPPKVIKALSKKIIAGEPIVKPVKPNYGNEGGVSIMQQYTTDDGLAMDAISFGPQSSVCDQ